MVYTTLLDIHPSKYILRIIFASHLIITVRVSEEVLTEYTPSETLFNVATEMGMNTGHTVSLAMSL
jgi:hypothetical protein